MYWKTCIYRFQKFRKPKAIIRMRLKYLKQGAGIVRQGKVTTINMLRALLGRVDNSWEKTGNVCRKTEAPERIKRKGRELPVGSSAPGEVGGLEEGQHRLPNWTANRERKEWGERNWLSRNLGETAQGVTYTKPDSRRTRWKEQRSNDGQEQPRHQITDPGSSEHIHQEPHWGRSQANCKKWRENLERSCGWSGRRGTGYLQQNKMLSYTGLLRRDWASKERVGWEI